MNSREIMSARPSRLMSTPEGYFVLAGAVVLVILGPFFAQSDYWMSVFSTTALFAVAAIGLSLLTGYAGQVSLGHAAFITIGSYSAAYFGATQGWPFWAWLLMSGIIGGLVGLILGPFSLRFKGNYLVVITLALIFITVHIVKSWESVTGGNRGITTGSAELNLGPVDFANLSILGREFTREQGIYYLAWIMVGIAALVARNIVRTRPGRAFQAIRDRDIASEVLGINNTSFKIAVFTISSAMASMAGAVFAVQQRFISPRLPLEELFRSIEFLAIIVLGGLGTVYGAILGALFLGPFEEVIEELVHYLDFNIPILDRPFVSNKPGPLFSVSAFSSIVYAGLLILLLIFQPSGMAGFIRKMQAKIRNLGIKIRSGR